MGLTFNIVVRPFGEGDAAEVAALIETTLLTSNAADYTLDELRSIAQWYQAAGLVSRIPYAHRFVAVARVDGDAEEIVGTAARRSNRLEGFFVSPDWQRCGIGEQLLATLEDDARRDAMRVVWLESSLTAVGFYQRMGFVAVGGPRDNGEGLIVSMRKRLV